MHTIIETPVFIRSAEQAGVTGEELHHIKTVLSLAPESGEIIPGTGGARKIRFAARGKGKSGGYRVITFYTVKDIPLFLLDVYAKGEKISLTQNEKKMLKRILGELVDTYRGKQ